MPVAPFSATIGCVSETRQSICMSFDRDVDVRNNGESPNRLSTFWFHTILCVTRKVAHCNGPSKLYLNDTTMGSRISGAPRVEKSASSLYRVDGTDPKRDDDLDSRASPLSIDLDFERRVVLLFYERQYSLSHMLLFCISRPMREHCAFSSTPSVNEVTPGLEAILASRFTSSSNDSRPFDGGRLARG